MVFNNNASNQANNSNDNNSNHQNNKDPKEAMSLQWISMTTFHSDDKTNPAEAGLFYLITNLPRLISFIRVATMFAI